MNTPTEQALPLPRTLVAQPVAAPAAMAAPASRRRMNPGLYLFFLIGSSLGAIVSFGLAQERATREAAGAIPLFVLLAAVTGIVFVARMWGSLAGRGARTSGAVAALGLFVPLFNLYWVFQVFPGFATDFNRAAERAGIGRRVSFGLMVAYVLLSWVPVVGLVLACVAVWQVCSAVNALHAAPLPTTASATTARTTDRKASRVAFAAPAQWPAVAEQWAASQGYRLVEEHAAGRVYRKGTGFLVAPMYAALTQEGPQLMVEGWIAPNLFARLSSLFILPAKMGLQSGGFVAVLPRKMGRNAVNQLLRGLGGPEIA